MTRETAPLHVAVVSGSRAEFGLLAPVIEAIDEHQRLQRSLIITGLHLLPAIDTIRDVRARFSIEAQVEMQRESEGAGRASDMNAFTRGVDGLGASFAALVPDVVLVLGDRIEAFAASCAASLGGRVLAHIHGGDRAEGVADEAMRHAITKLANIHFPATPLSRSRILQMGEPAETVFCTGSPAIDGLKDVKPMTDDEVRAFGIDPARPFGVVLQHPAGLSEVRECSMMQAILESIESDGPLDQFILFAPNQDPGVEGVRQAIGDRRCISSVPRNEWIALLRRADVLIGNSSSGLIECSALGVPCVNVGPRQDGRERPGSVVDVSESFATPENLRSAVQQARGLKDSTHHPYGDGTAGRQIAERLATFAGRLPSARKRNAY